MDCRFGGTSGSAPIVVGAVALMLEADPTLTADQVRTILRATAVADGNTSTLPNADWGFGKLDVHEAVRAVAGILFEDGFESGDLGAWSSATN